MLLVPQSGRRSTTMAAQLYKQGTIWWGYVYDQTSGARIPSTKCKDKRAAEAVVREWERATADPVYAATHSATLPEVFSRFLSDRTAKGRAEGTVEPSDQGRTLGPSARRAYSARER